MARSISPASRTSTGRNSTPNDGATAWIAAELAAPGRQGRITQDRCSRHARGNLFEQLQPFPARCHIRTGKSGSIAARPRQVVDVTGADRVGDCTNTIGTVRVACSNGAMAAPPVARMTSGASATNSVAYLRTSLGIARAQR